MLCPCASELAFEFRPPSNEICGIFMHPLFIENSIFCCLDTIKLDDDDDDDEEKAKNAPIWLRTQQYIKNSQRNLFMRSFNIRWKWIFHRYISLYCRKTHTHTFTFDPSIQIRITDLRFFLFPSSRTHAQGSEGSGTKKDLINPAKKH